MTEKKYNEEGDDLYMSDSKITDDVGRHKSSRGTIESDHKSALIRNIVVKICDVYELGLRVGRCQDPDGPCPYVAGSPESIAWIKGYNKGRGALS